MLVVRARDHRESRQRFEIGAGRPGTYSLQVDRTLTNFGGLVETIGVIPFGITAAAQVPMLGMAGMIVLIALLLMASIGRLRWLSSLMLLSLLPMATRSACTATETDRGGVVVNLYEVAGSNPVTPTDSVTKKPASRRFFFPLRHCVLQQGRYECARLHRRAQFARDLRTGYRQKPGDVVAVAAKKMPGAPPRQAL